MRPKKHEATREDDLFRSRLDQIINTKHELVQLGRKIDWAWIDTEIAPLYSDKGRPGIESRFVVGLLLLKHMFGLSDEGVCDRWVYDPYFQHFTGETFFQHHLPARALRPQPLEEAPGRRRDQATGTNGRPIDRLPGEGPRPLWTDCRHLPSFRRGSGRYHGAGGTGLLCATAPTMQVRRLRRRRIGSAFMCRM